MDGVSGALAILSFGIQLVETVQKARKFLKDIKNAPTELEELLDTLDQFEGLLIAVNGFVERQNNIADLQGPIAQTEGALRRCQRTVEKLAEAIDTIKTYFRVHGRTRKAFASLKTAGRKDDIKKLRGQVQENITVLQSALLLNSSHLQLSHFELVTNPEVPNHVESIPASNFDAVLASSPKVDKKSNGSMIVSKCVDVWEYQGLLGRINLRRKTTFLRTHSSASKSTSEDEVSHESHISVQLSLLSTVFDICLNPGWLLTPRQITFFPVLRRNPDLGEVMRGVSRSQDAYNCSFWSVFQSVDTDDFKLALSRRKLSPFVRDEYGWSLLHYASLTGNSELCSLLIQIGVDVDHRDFRGTCALILAQNSEVLTLLGNTQDEITCDDVLQYFYIHHDLSQSEIECLLAACQGTERSEESSMQLFSLCLQHAVRQYGMGLDQWASTIMKLLKSISGMHAWLQWTRDGDTSKYSQTILDSLFFGQTDPSQGASRAQKLLRLISESGYDIDSYLQQEKDLHVARDMAIPPLRIPPRRPRKLIVEFDANPRVGWDWALDSSHPLALVLQEFPLLNPAPQIFGTFEDWKYREREFWLSFAYHWMELWPYEFPQYTPCWSDLDEPAKTMERFSSWREWYEDADKTAKRYYRRARRKYPGFYEDKEENTTTPAVPGAWV